jgi:pyruvate-formate lyase-activating enzyme
MFGDTPNSFCSRCYHEEQYGDTSRRHKCNQKSVIFTKSNFQDSYQQSPGLAKFEFSQTHSGQYHGMPIDLHIDLGNYCNLACKMCNARASSSIAAQHVKWGIVEAKKYVGTDWTRDETTWRRVLRELSEITHLKNIHFMGGETLITSRFEDFVDYMLAAGRTDLNFSFVTNGTVFKPNLIKKLLQFQRVGIEVSIETLTPHNQYQRQGTDNDQVLRNIARYRAFCDGDRVTLTARPAISLLTVGYYHTLLEYCWQQKIVVKGLLVTNPRYLDVRILPKDAKKIYQTSYLELANRLRLDVDSIPKDYNESDPNMIDKIIRHEIDRALALLATDTPQDSDQQLRQMVSWCRRWDDVYDFDARSLYPEFAAMLDRYGY